MLTEQAKERLARPLTEGTPDIVDLSRNLGPKEFVQNFIDMCPDRRHPDLLSVLNNQEEAEKYIAGMMGMM